MKFKDRGLAVNLVVALYLWCKLPFILYHYKYGKPAKELSRLEKELSRLKQINNRKIFEPREVVKKLNLFNSPDTMLVCRNCGSLPHKGYCK